MKRALRCLALCASLGVPFSASAGLAQLSDLFVFGDSLSDGGNSGLLTGAAAGFVFPPSPYAGGRYSNGPVAVEYLWKQYNPGNPSGFRPSLAGGTNYAIGGATTGTANFNTVNPNVPAGLRPVFNNQGNASQLQQFTSAPPAFAPSTSLFVVWLFPNDVFLSAAGMSAGTVPGSPPSANPVVNGIANILTTIQTLAAFGAQHFLVPNMPDLGGTPEFLGTPESPFLSGVTAAFNAALAAQLTLLDANSPIGIVQFDTAGAFDAILDNPGAFGFTNTTGKCVDNLLNGQCNPNTWVFWDGVHPTTRAHEILGLQFAQAVPEPRSLALLALGLAGLGFSRRGR